METHDVSTSDRKVDVDEAARLTGFALFNHAKGNKSATETLLRKIYFELTGHKWDGK